MDPATAFLSITQFAAFVGACKNTVLAWKKRGMPCIQDGRFVRIPREQAIAWLAQQGRQTVAPPVMAPALARSQRVPTRKKVPQ